MHKLRQRAVRAPHRLCSLLLLRKGAGSTADHAVAAPSRSFSHRVKGTSMSTFSAEEVAKLQAGGNDVRTPVFVVWERESSVSASRVLTVAQVARALYQHDFNMPLPDSECVASLLCHEVLWLCAKKVDSCPQLTTRSNLRDLAGITAFVKAVYVDKRYMAGQVCESMLASRVPKCVFSPTRARPDSPQSRAAPAAASRPTAAAPVRSSFDTFAGPDTHAVRVLSAPQPSRRVCGLLTRCRTHGPCAISRRRCRQRSRFRRRRQLLVARSSLIGMAG
jgi:hypothetical protein